MIPIETLASFFIISIVLGLTPGPDNIFVLTQSALYGRKAGLIVTLGLCSGLLIHTSAVALGIAILFQNSAFAFALLKTMGIIYLLYLAYKSFQSSMMDTENTQTVCLTQAQLYRRGIIMNVTNPKVSIFFLAFLPQFINPENGAMTTQFFLLGLLFVLATILVFGTITLMAAPLGTLLKQSITAQKILNYSVGVIFIGIALHLFYSSPILQL